jgi:hypothetical protein
MNEYLTSRRLLTQLIEATWLRSYGPLALVRDGVDGPSFWLARLLQEPSSRPARRELSIQTHGTSGGSSFPHAVHPGHRATSNDPRP